MTEYATYHEVCGASGIRETRHLLTVWKGKRYVPHSLRKTVRSSQVGR